MKVLITGGNGMVGKAIRRNITDTGNEYVFSSRASIDFTDPTETLDYIYNIAPDVVIHLAANVGGLYKNMNNGVDMFEDNLYINLNILRACRQTGVRKVISILSTCVFPDGLDVLTANNIQDGPPHPSNEGYSYAKRMLEVQTRLYRQQGLDYSCVIPCNLYGPDDNFDLKTGHVIANLIRKCCVAMGTVQVLGTGKALRQFMYVDDFAKILLMLVNTPSLHSSIVVCPKEEVTIKEVVELIVEQVNPEITIVYDTSFSDGQYRKYALGDVEYPFTELKEGIRKTIAFYNELRITK